MKLLIMRHAEALSSPDDFARPLSTRGLEQAQQQGINLARFMSANSLTFDVMISSDLQRARQTISALSSQLTNPPELLQLKAFRPESSAGAAFDALQVFDGKNVLVVSHMPLVSSLDHWLCLEGRLDFDLAQMQLYDVSLMMKGEATRLPMELN